MAVVINGTTGITSVNGSAAAPSVTGTDTDTGIVYGTNTLSLATGGVAAVTVGSTGNVDIPVAGAVLTLNRGAYSQQTKLYQDTGGTGAIYETTNPSVNAQYYAHVFKGTNNAPTTLDFARINQFGIGLGSASPSSGTGITFPATQSASSDANTLDDYEEGTWVPTLLSTGATFTYPRGQAGSYCKIGSLVYAQFYIGADASGTTSNQCNLASLPFPSANLGALYQASACAWVSNTTAIGFTVNNNSSEVTIWRQNIGTTGTASAAQVAGGYLVGTVIYRAA